MIRKILSKSSIATTKLYNNHCFIIFCSVRTIYHYFNMFSDQCKFWPLSYSCVSPLFMSLIIKLTQWVYNLRLPEMTIKSNNLYERAKFCHIFLPFRSLWPPKSKNCWYKFVKHPPTIIIISPKSYWLLWLLSKLWFCFLLNLSKYFLRSYLSWS